MNKQLLILMKYEWKKLIKNPIQIFFLVVFPTIWITTSGILWGAMKVEGHYYIEITFSSFVVMEILALTISKIPTALAYDKEFKTLKHFAILKIKKNTYLTSIFIVNYFLFIIIFLLLTIIATTAFHMPFSINIFYMFIVASLLFAASFYLGMILISLSKRYQTTMSICYISFYILFFLSGAAIPAHIIGEWFVYIQKITPAGNGVILLQQLNLGTKINSDLFPIIYLSITTIAIPAIAIKIFKYQ